MIPTDKLQTLKPLSDLIKRRKLVNSKSNPVKKIHLTKRQRQHAEFSKNKNHDKNNSKKNKEKGN